MCPLQYSLNIELIRNFQTGLSFCFDCLCGAAIWSGCDVSAIAPAKNAKQKKIGLQLVEWNPRFVGGFLCVSLRICVAFSGMQFPKTHEVDISDVSGLLHSSSFHRVFVRTGRFGH